MSMCCKLKPYGGVLNPVGEMKILYIILVTLSMCSNFDKSFEHTLKPALSNHLKDDNKIENMFSGLVIA